jgi:hypothetical protein
MATRTGQSRGREIGHRGLSPLEGRTEMGNGKESIGPEDPEAGREPHPEEAITTRGSGRGNAGGGTGALGDDNLFTLLFPSNGDLRLLYSRLVYVDGERVYIFVSTEGREVQVTHAARSHDSQPLRLSTTTNMSGYNVLFVLVIVAALMATSWVFTPKGPNQT